MSTTTTERQERPRKLTDLLTAKLLPHRFLAAQLRRPSGRFGKWVMTRVLDNGNAALVKATVDALDLQPEDIFLDVGFGGGLALRLAAERTEVRALWGADFSPDVVVAGQHRLAALIAAGRLNLVAADIAELPLRDGLASAICTTNTIYFWPDPQRALHSLRRVAGPRGRVAIGYSGAAKMSKFDGIVQHGFRLYEAPQVEAAMREAGYRDVRTQALSGGTSSGDFVTLGRA